MTAPAAPRRRPLWARLLLVGLLLLPVAEIVVIVLVARAIGWWTLLILVVLSILGGVLTRRQWSSTWASLQESLQQGRMPGRHLADMALVLAGGVLLMLPGFITAVVGAVLVIPFTRPLTRRLLQLVVARRMWVTVAGSPRRRGTDDEVIEGEIIDDEDEGH